VQLRSKKIMAFSLQIRMNHHACSQAERINWIRQMAITEKTMVLKFGE
jgi:hypothetical protein